jgi:hypothetical protein
MKKISFLLVLIFLIAEISCTKNQLGGKSTVSGTVAHHSKSIPNATVFIKFGSKEFPGKDTTKYDDKVYADADGKYSFKCYKGNYYLYATGIDNTASPPAVSGGIPVKVKNNETVSANIPVTE